MKTKKSGSVKITPETHSKLRIYAAVRGLDIQDVADKAILTIVDKPYKSKDTFAGPLVMIKPSIK